MKKAAALAAVPAVLLALLLFLLLACAPALLQAAAYPADGPTPVGDSLVLPNAGRDGLPAGFTLPPGTPHRVVVALDFAASKLGLPYQYGGTGDPGYDCSGLMQAAYAAAGLRIARTTYDQVDDGQPVALPDIEPGDLVFIPGSDGTLQSPGHVGLYLGRNLVLQAPHSGTTVQATPLDGGAAFGPIAAIRRIDVTGS